MTKAYFLVAHGSRDPRPQLALKQIAEQLRILPFDTASPVIGTGILECSPLSLSQQLQQFAHQIRPYEITQIQILPLFLLPGVHVKEDIPVEVAIAQQILGSDITLQVLPYLGSHVEKMATVLTQQMQLLSPDTWILIAHGSRRQGGNRPIETLAQQLGATPAYWSVSPHLSEQIEVLIQQGSTHIGVLPYFLFTGGITDAITQLLQDCSQQFPHVKFNLAQPLDQTLALTELAQILLF
jgi:sirohydrochlorin ferrochelatase